MAVNGSPPRTTQGYMSEHLGWGATLTEVLETVPDLVWPTSVRTYASMRNDPQLTAVLNAYTLPLRQAAKYVDPAGCRPEVVKLVADDLGLPILGTKLEPGPARRRGVDFDEHFRVALLNLIFGHMPFAQGYEIRDGQARLVELAERMPSTITDILTKDNGDLDGILQFGENTIIPASNLVWYCHEREGAAWMGRSMLRSAYGAWLLKHEMWRTHATSNRRFGMGVPTVEAPPGATDQQIQQAALLASSIRVGDQSGAGLPNGFRLKLEGISGSTPDTMGFIRYLDGQMAQMALASVLNLDASPNGSRALGDTFVNLMLTSLNAIGREMATVLTRLAVQMVDYNFGDQENVPRVVIGDVGSRPEVTAEAIVALLGAGALSPDPELEAWVRDHWTLPEKPPVEEDGPAGADPRNIVEMVQKVYLGVDVVLSAEEAREILNAAGANLTGPAPMNPDAMPAPAPVPSDTPMPTPDMVMPGAVDQSMLSSALRAKVQAAARNHRSTYGGFGAGWTVRPRKPEAVLTKEQFADVSKIMASGRRQLTSIEAASKVDPDKLDEQWSTALDELINNWSSISEAQRTQLVNQIKAAVHDDKIDALADLAIDSQDGAEILGAAMLEMADAAAKEMKREAKDQGVTVSGEQVDEDRMGLIATAVAAIVAAGLAGAAGREALRIWAPGAKPDDVAAKVGDHLGSLSDSHLRDQLGNALSTAQNMARQAVLEQAPPGKYFASEVMDKNTCGPCKDIDGTEFASQKEAGETYASGGYNDCLGRLRCRGIVVAVWDD